MNRVSSSESNHRQQKLSYIMRCLINRTTRIKSLLFNNMLNDHKSKSFFYIMRMLPVNELQISELFSISLYVVLCYCISLFVKICVLNR